MSVCLQSCYPYYLNVWGFFLDSFGKLLDCAECSHAIGVDMATIHVFAYDMLKIVHFSPAV